MFYVRNHNNYDITIDNVVIPAFAEVPFTDFVDKQRVNQLLNKHSITVIDKPLTAVCEIGVTHTNESEGKSQVFEQPKRSKRKANTALEINDNAKGDTDNASDEY